MTNHKLIERNKIFCNKYFETFVLTKSYYCPFCNVEMYEDIRQDILNFIMNKRQTLGYKKKDDFILNQMGLNEF